MLKMKKKVTSVLLALTMALGLAACGSDSGTTADDAGSTGDTQSAASESADTGNAITSYDDLTGKKIGVQLGTTGDIDYATPLEGQDGTSVERYNKGADAVQALKTGKIDCVIIDEQPANSFVSKNDDLMIVTEGMGDEEEYAICIDKSNTDLTQAFNQAIAELKEDGTLDSIVDNYIGDNVGESPYVTPDGTEYPNGTLTMATNAEFEPYEYYEGTDVVGIDVDMAKAICDKLGYELKVEDMEFDAIITAVTSGKADFGAAGMTVTEDRLKNIDFTDTYTTARQVMIVRRNG
jgi:polar amino acid transport system substrate-binding protein